MSKSLRLLAFLPEEGEGHVDALDLSQPALVFGSTSAEQQVVFDLVEPGQHLGIYREHGATQRRMLVLARRPVGVGAAAQLDLALIEVLFETASLGFGDRLVLVGRPGLGAPVEKALLVADDVVVEYGDVAPSCLKVQMPE